MPELSRFYGIIIRMYFEAGGRHNRPHFHAYYQESSAVFGIDPVETLGGELPTKQHRLVVAWAELHRDELSADWSKLLNGQAPDPIRPLS